LDFQSTLALRSHTRGPQSLKHYIWRGQHLAHQPQVSQDTCESKTLDAWRSGSACDSSNADIHKVIRSNRVAFIGLTTHGGHISFAGFL
jgi:hypothetical protein